MSPSFRVLGAARAIAIRSRPLTPCRDGLPRMAHITRLYSDDASQQPPKSTKGASKPVSSEVSQIKAKKTPAEDAAKLNKSSNDEELPTDRLTDTELEQVLYGGRPSTSNVEGGLTEAQEEALYREGSIPSPDIAEALVAAAESSTPTVSPSEQELQNPGHKFALPRKPYPEGYNVKKRYHPVLEQISRLLMRDGKLSVAQKNMALVMNYLRTSPAPIYSPKFPLLPGTPPASHLPLNPVLYITIAIDSVAPLIKINRIAGAAGGGRALELPHPLAVRQRRRTAFMWILDVVEKKPSKGSGRKQFAHRLAEEIIAVVEGRSSVWDKRKILHKLGTATRANVNSRKAKTKVKKM